MVSTAGIQSGTGPLPPLQNQNITRNTGETTAPPVTPPAGEETVAGASADSVSIDQQNTEAATFDPASGVSFPEPPPPLPSLDDPITGVLKGEELQARLKALEAEVGIQLEAAHARHAEAVQVIEQTGSFHNKQLNDVLRAQHAIDFLTQVQDLLKMGNPDAVRQLQILLKRSATSEETGSKLGTDNLYGPGTDRMAVGRIREPENTYVERNFNPTPEDEFVYQFGEVGEAGGTAMEAQANCGPASMAMLIERMGGDAPSMKDIRRESNAPIGNRRGTYGLDTDQVERGLQSILGAQGIPVETDTQIFYRRDTDKLIEAMRAGLAAGDKMMLLTSNLESGGKGHYIVINEVREDGSIVVHDPQSQDGQNRVYTRDELAEGLRVRSAYGRESRLVSVRPAPAAPPAETTPPPTTTE